MEGITYAKGSTGYYRGGKEMPSIKGSFSGGITKQSEISLTDQPNHVMNIAEVSGTQKSCDPLWNDAKITTKNGATTVVGTWKYAGGNGKYRGIKGSGKFKVVMKSQTDLACNWSGNYRLPKAR